MKKMNAPKKRRFYKYFKKTNKIMRWLNVVLFSLVLSLILSSVYFYTINKWSKITKYLDTIIAASLMIFITIAYFCYLLKNTYKNKSINYVDLQLRILSYMFLINVFTYCIAAKKYGKIWLRINLALFIFIMIFIIVRVYYTYSGKGTKEANVITLEEFLEKDLNKESIKNLCFSDEPSKVNLLGRTHIVNQVQNIIKNIELDNRFVFGIEGTWGSGKTTLLNIILEKISTNKSNNIVIKFDPWKYNSEEAMLKAMIWKVSNEMPLGMSNFKKGFIISEFIQSVFQDSKLGFFENLYEKTAMTKDLELITNINDYLIKNNKKLIFVIDNLDRTTNEQIYFVYKAVSSILTFKRTLYILAYDSRVVLNAFENLNFKSDYLDKIINQKIQLNTTIEMKHLSLKVHEKLMSYFDIKVDYNNDYLITTLTLMDNPRELKHVLNDVLLIPLEFIQAVHYADLISIINIQNNNLELYNLIYENQSYFISEQDRTLELITNIKAKELNKKSKEFFDECSKNKFWQKDLILLKEMFPNVKKYYEDNHNYYQISKEKKLESEKNRRISNFRYFSIYFNKVSNDFHKVSLAAEKLVENLKKSSFEEQFLDIIIDVEKMNSFDQLLFLESMDIYANEYLIDEEFDNLIVLLEIIYPSLDDSIQYFVPKPRQMSYIYISTYLSKLSNEVFDKRIKEMFENYDNLYLLFIIEQDVASESINGFPNKNYNLKRAETINELFEMKINEIINNNIDLYNNEYTIKGSALVPYLKYKEKNFDKVKKYYEKIINEKNINKFLFDMATEGYDGKYYSYSIKVEEVHEILNQHLIEKHITRAEKTKENLEIFDIYNKSKTIKDLTFQAAKKYIKPLKFFSP